MKLPQECGRLYKSEILCNPINFYHNMFILNPSTKPIIIIKAQQHTLCHQ